MSLNIILITLTILIVIVIQCCGDNSSNLQTVIIIGRHGDRTPTKSFLNDPYKDDSYWPDGWGQLTIAGKKRMYKLGQFYRKRYDHFLTNNPREVFAQSSERQRCLESIQLILAGLYPPKDRWVWNQELQWQPIIVKTTATKDDAILSSKFLCPNADKELSKIRNSDIVTEYAKIHQELFDKLTMYSGLNVSKLMVARKIISAMKIQRQNGYKQPEWFTDAVLEQMQQIHGHSFYFDARTRKIQRLRSGALFGEIKRILNLKTVKTKDNKFEQEKKLYLFSTHDTKVTLMLNALKVFNMKPPPFGSSIIIELYSQFNDYYLRSFFFNETDTDDVSSNLLRFSFCNQNDSCTLKQFLDYIDVLIPLDWKQECGLSNQSFNCISNDHQMTADAKCEKQNSITN